MLVDAVAVTLDGIVGEPARAVDEEVPVGVVVAVVVAIEMTVLVVVTVVPDGPEPEEDDGGEEVVGVETGAGTEGGKYV